MLHLAKNLVSLYLNFMEKVKIIALYKFTELSSLEVLKNDLYHVCSENAVKGTFLIASEGINGTIAGQEVGIDNVENYIRKLPNCSDVNLKISFAAKMPFLHLKIKIKNEIVTMGVPYVNPSHLVGRYVDAKHWDEFISSEKIVLVDTRNDYEVSIGTFEGAINPNTQSFREFPNWWSENSENLKNKKIAMFCTGGIRCEKSTNFLLSEGVKEVYHLKGGILKYFESANFSGSKWSGECFVFDQRVAVKPGLLEGSYSLCFACRRPVSPQDKNHIFFEEGVSCHNCYFQHPDERKAGFRERQKQFVLQKRRGQGKLK